MKTPIEPAGVVRYRLEIVVEAPLPRVWQALTRELADWWLPSFHILGEGSRVTFEAEAGGKLLERHPNGASLLWYTVNMVVPEQSLHMVGHSMPDWGGPSTTLIQFAVEERGNATALIVSDCLYGHVSEAHVTSLREGWTELFTDGLKRHVER